MFEQQLIDDGILLYKYWLTVDQKQQEERFPERAADPLKRWKLSPIDLEARTIRRVRQARDAMFAATHSRQRPGDAVEFNDQRRGRLNLIRHLLDHTPDVTLPDEPLELPPLAGEPKRGSFQRTRATVVGPY